MKHRKTILHAPRRSRREAHNRSGLTTEPGEPHRRSTYMSNQTEHLRALLEDYAIRLYGGSEGKSATECAQIQGWIDADGKITPSGRDAARAFDDQSNTRSAFRIG